VDDGLTTLHHLHERRTVENIAMNDLHRDVVECEKVAARPHHGPNAMTGGDRLPHDVRSDQSAGAGDENLHPARSFRSASTRSLKNAAASSRAAGWASFCADLPAK
jgi:hypothetical protein